MRHLVTVAAIGIKYAAVIPVMVWGLFGIFAILASAYAITIFSRAGTMGLLGVGLAIGTTFMVFMMTVAVDRIVALVVDMGKTYQNSKTKKEEVGNGQ